MSQIKRKELITDVVNIIVQRQRMLIARDLASDLNHWKKQFDIDTPLIDDIIRQTEEYTKKFLGGKGCAIVLWIFMTLVLCVLFGGYGIFMGIMGLVYSLSHTTPSLFGNSVNEKDVALKKLIESKIILETNLKKHIAAGCMIPDEFINSLALVHAKKIISSNPKLTSSELFSELRMLKADYESSLTPNQKKVLFQLPYQVRSYYIFKFGRRSKL